DRTGNALSASVDLDLAPVLPELAYRLRRLCDLDAEPLTIAAHLGQDPLLGQAVARRAGLRLPGAFDPFEMAVRAILGQEVSVSAATTLAGRLVERFGIRLGSPSPSPSPSPLPSRIFPTPPTLAALSTSQLAGIGMPGARANAVIALAGAVASGRLELDGD